MRARVIHRKCGISALFASPSQLRYGASQWNQRAYTTASKASAENKIEENEQDERLGGSISDISDVRYPSKKKGEPLRILYFGTDQFSSAVLSVLHKNRKDLGIKSIDVVGKKPRPTGRGLQKLPISAVRWCAEKLKIPFHEIDNFTPDWNPPTPHGKRINLIVTVSFGLLIPERVISRTRYGGLNLHPSDLPNLRGAAPLYHTILEKMRTTRVSLQTLHPTKFDHGIVVARSEPVNIPLAVRLNGYVKSLRDLLSPIAADLLVEGLRHRVYVPPLIEAPRPADERAVLPAPKITKEDQRIDWARWKRRDIKHRRLVVGPLWSMLSYLEKRVGDPPLRKEVRVIFRQFTVVPDSLAQRYPAPAAQTGRPGSVAVLSLDETKPDVKSLGVWTLNEQLLVIDQMTVDSDKNGRNPVEALQRLRVGDYSLWPEEMRFL